MKRLRHAVEAVGRMPTRFAVLTGAILLAAGLWFLDLSPTAIGVSVGLVAAGIWLWWPSREDWQHRAALGAGLLGGAVVAIAVLFLQNEQDKHQRETAERQSLVLTLGLQRRLPGIDLHGRDLRAFYLVKKILPRANLVGANLSGANLTAINLRDADAREANFAGADLEGALLGRARLEGAHFEGACLARARMRGAEVAGAHFEYAGLDATSFGGRLIHVNFDHASLRQSDFRGTYMSNVSARAARLPGANFSGITSTLWDTDFSEADLGEVPPRVYNRRTGSGGTTVSGANFRGATLIRVNFTGANLSGTVYREHGFQPFGAIVVFPSNNVRGVASDSGFRVGAAYPFDAGGSCGVVTFTAHHAAQREVFTGVDFRGTDLREVTFKDTNLRGVIADRDTRWPKSFTAETARAAGVIFVGPEVS